MILDTSNTWLSSEVVRMVITINHFCPTMSALQKILVNFIHSTKAQKQVSTISLGKILVAFSAWTGRRLTSRSIPETKATSSG